MLGAVALGGCKVDATLAVRLREDGTGRVAVRLALDAAAVRAVEAGDGTVESRVILVDLAAAGWRLGRWHRTAEGGAWVELSKRFAGEAGLAARLRELAGRRVLGETSVERERGVFRSRDEVALVADLRSLATGVRGDGELLARLEAAGADVGELDARFTTAVRDAFTLHVRLEGPRGETREWRLRAGDRERMAVSSSEFASARATAVVAAAAVAALALLLLVAAGTGPRRGARRPAGDERDLPTW